MPKSIDVITLVATKLSQLDYHVDSHMQHHTIFFFKLPTMRVFEFRDDIEAFYTFEKPFQQRAE